MPSVFGKDSKKKELIKNLGETYERLQREHGISPGDFPDLRKMQERLQVHDFTKFNVMKLKLIETVDKMLAEDIAKLMTALPLEEAVTDIQKANVSDGTIRGDNLGRLWVRAIRRALRPKIRLRMPYVVAQMAIQMNR